MSQHHEAAVARWVADKINVDPKRVMNVDFEFEHGAHYPSGCIDAEAGLSYLLLSDDGTRWTTEHLSLDEFGVTPGELVEQCIAILFGALDPGFGEQREVP